MNAATTFAPRGRALRRLWQRLKIVAGSFEVGSRPGSRACARRRLLECLQERVGGGAVERIGWGDDGDLVAALVACQCEPRGELANLLDADLPGGIFEGLQRNEIRMPALGGAPAACTYTAGRMIRWIRAQTSCAAREGRTSPPAPRRRVRRGAHASDAPRRAHYAGAPWALQAKASLLDQEDRHYDLFEI